MFYVNTNKQYLVVQLGLFLNEYVEETLYLRKRTDI